MLFKKLSPIRKPESEVIYIDLLIVLKKGKVKAVMCCANGTDSSHELKEGKDYAIFNEDKVDLKNEKNWLTPKVYFPKEEVGDNY